MMNTSLVLIKPHACRERFLDAARDHFNSYGVRVDDMMMLTGFQVRCGAYIERHYSSVAALSACPSEDLAAFMSEETASLFFAAFDELWDTVMEERRVLTPEDAMTILGLTSEELNIRWWKSKSRARIEHGFYVSYFEEERMYVINGFYPKLLESFNAPESQTCIFIVSWPESMYSWKRFRLEILGAADPSESAPTSLRRLLFENWESYGLSEKPNLMNNGFDSASGPLEALAHRFVWMHRRANEDEFGRALLQEDIPMEFLERILKNHSMSYGGENRPVFELLENMQSSEVIHHVAVLFSMDKQKKAKLSPNWMNDTGNFSCTADWTIVLEDEDAEERRNRALVFIKPHANTPETRSLVEERLMQVTGMQVVNQRHVFGNEIKSREIMDKHYGTISRYAVKVPPSSIHVSTQNRAIFKETFGLSWKEALRCGRVWNAETAIHVLGEITSEELYSMWGASTKIIKINTGAYVAHFNHEGVFVINGFYPYLRDTYSAHDARVTCYVLSWPETCMTWRAFREELIGSTNPGNASPNSLRGLIRDKWRELGLQYPPTTTDNGVHASAGPLEAVLERHLWTKSPISHDPLMLRLQECGLTGAFLYNWGSNPEVTLRNGKRVGCVFDLLENMQTTEMVEVLREAEQQALATFTETPINRAIVILKPFAVNDRTIETVKQTLNTMEVHVTRELPLFSHQVIQRYLDSIQFRSVKEFANSNSDTLREKTNNSIKNKFRAIFHVVWDSCLEDERLLGATKACEELHLKPIELLQLWETSSVKKLGPSCYVALLKSHDTFVINGFVPFIQESYSKPGSHLCVFEVEWKESAWTWRDFCETLIGDPNDPLKAVEGSLQRLFAEEWTNYGLQLQPLSYTTAPIYASEGPLEAAADKEIWLGAELKEDLFVQQLLLEGVPLSLLLPYVRDETVSDNNNNNNNNNKQEEFSLITNTVRDYSRRVISKYQQSTEVIRRLKVITSRFLRGIKMNYAFIWVKPHACTSEVYEWVPGALAEHRIEVVYSGQLSMDEVIEKKLVDHQYSSLYRNAMTRNVSELPITTKQMVEFERTFGITWNTAINLHMIINAYQAVERIGEVKLLEAWDNAIRKVCLSSSLYVAYLEEEGLYVVNGFYPYLRSRMYTGSRIFWYIVSWDGEIMTWNEFQEYVIGGDVPSAAATASLRHALSISWMELGLQQPPDGVDNGFHASATPIEGLADRLSWLNARVEKDIFGRLLIQAGVSGEFLQTVLQNPMVRHRDEPIDSASDAFDKMCTENPLLVAQLIGLQASGGMHLIRSRLHSGGVLIPHPPIQKQIDNKNIVNNIKIQNNHSNNHNETSNGRSIPIEEKTNSTIDFTSVAATTTTTTTTTPESFKRNYAFILVNPKCASVEGEELLTAYITDFLQRHKIQVESGGSIRGIAPSLRHMMNEIQVEVFKYAVKQSPFQYAIDGNAMNTFYEAFGEVWDSRRIRNAVDVAVEFNLSALRLKEIWDECTLRKRIAPSLYVGKMKGSLGYIVNGFALHTTEIFNLPTSVKKYFLISWKNEDFDYAYYLKKIIGDPYIEAAYPGSLHHVLCDEWKIAGLQCPPDPFEGAIMTSTSALEAIQQRQLWLSLGFSHDPVGRFAINELGISPYILRWAATNPRSLNGDSRFLFDIAREKGSSDILQLLLNEENRNRTTPPRNSAFVLVKSHALCRPFATTIEAVFSRANVQIDEEGDLSGSVVRERGLVHHLYATASRYAVRDVSTIRLSKDERDAVRQQLGISWEQLVDGGIVVNAYRALELLGGVTPQHLYDKWRTSTRKAIIRPDFIIAELSENGIFVVNGFFPELKQSLESANALLHWYVVSWSEASMSWPTFLENVIGDENPESALSDSIRGQLFIRWREYGLATEPDLLRNGMHVSQGALQAMRERTKCLRYAVNEDYLGNIMLRHGVPERILRVWLDNPEVTSNGIEASVFEHLRHCNTSRLLIMLKALTDELSQEESSDAANAARLPYIENGSDDDQLRALTSIEVLKQQQQQQQQKEQNSLISEQKGVVNESDETLLFRNTAMIIVKPHVSENPKVIKLLQHILTSNNIQIKQELRKQTYPRLVDKHLSSPMYYATHNFFQYYPEVTTEGEALFYDTFGESWMNAVSSQRVLGAFDAINRFSMTPSQLYVKWSLPQQKHIQLAYDMEVMKLNAEGVYVINPILPFERERMIQAGPNMRDIYCYVVSWDQRNCSWQNFLNDIIGDVDPAKAFEASLRGRLYNGWTEFDLPVKPNRIDNIVLASEGPLQAFMERELWCGMGDLAPDPLVRAVCYLGQDPAELLEWKENPLVRYTGKMPDDECVTGRMFSFTHAMDTREFIALISEQDGYFVPLSPPSEVEAEAREWQEKEMAATSRTLDRRSPHFAATAASHPHSYKSYNNYNYHNNSNSRSDSPAEWLRETLLRASEEDVARLWTYYGGIADWTGSESESEAGATPTPIIDSLRGSIDGEAFRRDIEALDCFGLPLAKGTVQKLFEGMAWRGDGRATYEEFRVALAVLQQL